MIYAVYRAGTGTLVSVTQDATKIAPAAVLTANGLSVAERPDSEAGGIWDAFALRFNAVPPPTAPDTLDGDDPAVAATVQFLVDRGYLTQEQAAEALG